VSLAQYAVIATRSWAADSSNARVRLKAENQRLQEEVAQLRAEMGIKDARMKRLILQKNVTENSLDYNTRGNVHVLCASVISPGISKAACRTDARNGHRLPCVCR
jgi:hypothetical protein